MYVSYSGTELFNAGMGCIFSCEVCLRVAHNYDQQIKFRRNKNTHTTYL